MYIPSTLTAYSYSNIFFINVLNTHSLSIYSNTFTYVLYSYTYHSTMRIHKISSTNSIPCNNGHLSTGEIVSIDYIQYS